MSFRTIKAVAVASALSLGLAGGVSAQTTPVQPQPPAPNMPAPQSTVPEKVGPKVGDTTGTLSDRLEKSGGVITPPDPGTGRVITPPSAGSTPMPVIPPNGTPGSAQPNAAPK